MLAAFGAELLKLKRTLVLRLSLLLPLLMVAMTIYGNVINPSRIPMAWMEFATRAMWGWVSLMLPLFVTLEAALLADTDNRENMWKVLFALPVPRWNILASKLLIGILLVGFSLAALLCASVIGALCIGSLHLSEMPVALARPAFLLVCCWAASAALVTIQLWISLRWKGFVVPCATGIGATVVGLLAVRGQGTLARLYPWTLPGRVMSDLNHQAQSQMPSDPAMAPVSIAFSLAFTVMFAFFAIRESVRRDVA